MISFITIDSRTWNIWGVVVWCWLTMTSPNVLKCAGYAPQRSSRACDPAYLRTPKRKERPPPLQSVRKYLLQILRRNFETSEYGKFLNETSKHQNLGNFKAKLWSTEIWLTLEWNYETLEFGKFQTENLNHRDYKVKLRKVRICEIQFTF